MTFENYMILGPAAQGVGTRADTRMCCIIAPPESASLIEAG